MAKKDQTSLEKLYETVVSCCDSNKKNSISPKEIRLRMTISANAEEIKEYSNAIDHPSSISMLCQAMENLNRVYKELLDSCNQK